MQHPACAYIRKVALWELHMCIFKEGLDCKQRLSLKKSQYP